MKRGVYNNRIKRNKTIKPTMDYKNGKIYQILNNVNDEVYVGSTTQQLSKRFYWHKKNANCKTVSKTKVVELIRGLGVDKFYIELIELYPCNSKEELTAKEGHYIRERGTLNMLIAGRTSKQYKEDNKEHIKQTNKQWYENHKEQRAEKSKIYQEQNKAHITQYQK